MKSNRYNWAIQFGFKPYRNFGIFPVSVVLVGYPKTQLWDIYEPEFFDTRTWVLLIPAATPSIPTCNKCIFFLPWTAKERSTSVTLLIEAAWSCCFFLFFLDDELRRRLVLESPHILVPPWVDGIFKNVMPCNGGPSVKLRGTPSHWKI